MSVGDDDTIASSQPTMTQRGLAASDLVAGRYRIVRWIGGGGMGRVYEALDTELDERVALKVLKGDLSDDANERFRREVKLTRRIVHKNVARMFDIGDHEHDKFLTMELIDGEPLSGLIGATPMPWPRLRALGEQICAGLAAAHAAGVVHRDLKPDNVLVERGTDRAVITDFGIARGAEQDGGVTEIGTVVGTPRYMSPEQLAGRTVDARADVFSLGVMLFELATGTRPWAGDNAVAVALAQQSTTPRTIDSASAGVPGWFVTLVAACLRLDAAARPASAELVGTALATGDVDALGNDLATRAIRPSRPSAPKLTPVPATPTLADPTSLAVLPIACGAGDEYLADGLLEDVTDALSTTPGLRVRPAGVVRSQTAPDPRELGRKLHVDHVVALSLRRVPTGLRLNARLIGVAEGFQLWAHRIDFAEADILAIGNDLVDGIARALSARASQSSASTKLTDPRAVELYLRARAEQRRFWAPHQIAAAELLEKAAEISPTSTPILAALAHASVLAWVLSGEREREPRARAAVERGLATGHGEAYLASAQFNFNHNEFERGGHDLGVALVRAPMSAPAHELAGNILVEIDAPVTARHHYETARELDPGRSLVITSLLARLDALEGKFDEADARVRQLVEHEDPSVCQMGRVQQTRLAGWRGRMDEVVAGARLIGPRLTGGAAHLTDLVHKAVRDGTIEADAWRAAWIEYTPDPQRPRRQPLLGLQVTSEVLLALGRHDAALDTLEAAAREGLIDLVWLDACPLFQSVAQEPRFHAVRVTVAARAASLLAAFRAATLSG